MNNFDNLILQLANDNIKFRENEPMSKHTTFHIGGNVRVMIFPTSESELKKCLENCKSCAIKPFILGNGSNLLCQDENIDVAVIKLIGLDTLELVDETTIKCGAGVTLAKLANFAMSNGLTGLEFASGIPGTLGGGAVMNAGAYGGELKDVMFSTRCFDLNGQECLFTGDEQKFGYRTSAFADNNFIVVSGLLKLNKGNIDTIKARMSELNQKRRDKQPLEFPSAGSTFKRPVGGFAAALIDQCGLKGYSVGDAQVSEKHAGFVINRGHATCHDVLQLTNNIHRIVLEKTGISLELEIKRL